MRYEIQNVKAVLSKAAESARTYHERIEHVRNTCKPEVIMQEMKIYAVPLNEAMIKAHEEMAAEFSALEKNIKSKMIISAKDYNKDTVELMHLLTPDVEEFEAIAQQFAGNETMLRFFRKYRDDHALQAVLPIGCEDRLKALKTMRDDISWILRIAGQPKSAENKYGDDQLQHFAAEFEKVFKRELEIIGE